VLYFATIIVSFSACLVLGQIQDVLLRKVWSTSTGLFVGFFIYGGQYWWNIAFVLINYLLMRFLPRTAGSNAMVVFSSVCLLWAGIYTKYIDTVEKHRLDIDLIIMINFCKMHMLSVNYDNAGKLDDEIKSKYFTERER